MVEHHIQREIIGRLTHAASLRFSELKPDGMESNIFMYHLKQLIREGLIEKQDKLYVLTRDGKHFADRASLETMKIRVQPKIVTVLCVRRADGEWLLLRRKHQPFNDYKGFPSGKLHYGEPLQTAAIRELHEKVGLTGVDLALRGTIIMRFMDGTDVVNHVVGYVFYGEVPAATVVDQEGDNFHAYFGPETELYEEPSFKGHQQILEYLQSETMFIAEHEFTSDY